MTVTDASALIFISKPPSHDAFAFPTSPDQLVAEEFLPVSGPAPIHFDASQVGAVDREGGVQ